MISALVGLWFMQSRLNLALARVTAWVEEGLP